MSLTEGHALRLLRDATCPSLSVLPGAFFADLDEGGVRLTDAGSGQRADLLEVYRSRYLTVDAFRQGRVGWQGLFTALGVEGPPVGIFSYWRIGWRVIAFTDPQEDAVIAALVAAPKGYGWAEGAQENW